MALRTALLHDTNALQYYHLEPYLLDTVRPRFQATGALDAFDLFSIVIWKANRAKSNIARKLIAVAESGMFTEHADLDAIAQTLTASLVAAPADRDRLRILMQDWQFALPMASAILTIVWPESFNVYDVRACAELGDFTHLGGWTSEEKVWAEYQRHRDAVRAAVLGRPACGTRTACSGPGPPPGSFRRTCATDSNAA